MGENNYIYICQCLDSLLLLYNISIVVNTQNFSKKYSYSIVKNALSKNERACVDKNVKNNR